MAATSILVDVITRTKRHIRFQVFKTALMAVMPLTAVIATGIGMMPLAEGQAAAKSATGAGYAPTSEPPPSSVGVFPLSQVHRGLTGTAWTVFEGTKPEPMEVEILGVQRGARGPGQDLILARLHGAKPEYTGVVAGMSGSPVYVDGKLLGALSYRIGQFTKEPIAGITPIEQMLEVRDLPMNATAGQVLTASAKPMADSGSMTFAAMETPLSMSGFEPEAIRVWKERVAGTGLDVISAGGGSSLGSGSEAADGEAAPLVPGSAVSLQLVRGDLEIAATCTVTYIDPKQLLACGHPILQSGSISVPMTAAEIVATVASPLNAFKIVNTGRTIGAFTEDRDAAIRGEFGVAARMIPVAISVAGNTGPVERKVEVLDLPSMTANAVLVSVYETLLETNRSSAVTSYHVTGEIALKGQAPVPVDVWGTPGEQMVAQLAAALGVGESFNRLYGNAGREGPIAWVKLHVEAIPRDVRTELEGARLISSGIVHAGDTVVIEATLRDWQQPARNVRIPFTVPARLEPGTLRLMVGSSLALDRTLDAARPGGRQPSEDAVVARMRGLHHADQVYLSLLLPETQAALEGETLTGLPLSMANTMESQRTGLDVGLHGESVVVAAQAPAGGVLSGVTLLGLRVEAGGGLH
jgi:hypothetical protein